MKMLMVQLIGAWYQALTWVPGLQKARIDDMMI